MDSGGSSGRIVAPSGALLNARPLSGTANWSSTVENAVPLGTGGGGGPEGGVDREADGGAPVVPVRHLVDGRARGDAPAAGRVAHRHAAREQPAVFLRHSE